MLSRANSDPFILGWLTDKFNVRSDLQTSSRLLSRANSDPFILGWLTDKFSENNVI